MRRREHAHDGRLLDVLEYLGVGEATIPTETKVTGEDGNAFVLLSVPYSQGYQKPPPPGKTGRERVKIVLHSK